MTLVEVTFSLTIMALVAASVTAGFIFIQKYAVQAAYNTGAIRVLQAHVERCMSIPVGNLVSTTIVTYNYSGLRVSSLGNATNQAALTNNSLKSFVVYGSDGVGYSTNVSEDAVLAYTTVITVTPNTTYNCSFTNAAGTAQLLNNTFRTATITVYWENASENTMSNSAVVVRTELDN